ncbi:helix-turn-helix domain-containing protein [Flagellimonas hadalis]|uniref:Helix-turn-helix domain-containing protein n=1 Tax=Flagellimonas hadalis TaxID=2597517 RepID=A0A5N5IZG3_9FLAO|nr:XRE family transcriptional regulator [Allomuricauda hadalis]KAB5491436.1 helix-turn-helix domain-containing protein [Allomuricauda hadalis]
MGQTEYIVMWVGSKIKEIRRNKDLKLNDLSQQTGISIAMLSKIENGRVFPTWHSLLQIFTALDLNLNTFFNDLPKENEFSGYLLFRSNEYRSIEKEEEAKGFDYRLVLTRSIEKSALEISVLTLRPGASREKVSTDGFQFLFVVKGSVVYHIGKETLTLEEGDSLFFDGGIEHVPENKTAEEAFLLLMYFLTVN